MKLNEIKDNYGARNKFKRVGRGTSSGKGKTAGRGTKGQKSRSGVSINGFEGGQMSIRKRSGKIGFRSKCRRDIKIITTEFIKKSIEQNKINASEVITSQHIKDLLNISNSKSLIKLLFKDQLDMAINFDLDLYSLKAQEAISAVGGKIISSVKI